MTLAIFDLDNTLIGGDSDHLWGEFLINQNVVDGPSYKVANDRFYQDYQDGRLDVFAYQEFVLGAITSHTLESLQELHQRFMAEVIDPIRLPLADALVAKHRDQGHTLMVITATNDFITAPIVRQLGIEHLIATVAEQKGNRYTGRVAGVPSFREGKVERLAQWLREHHQSLEGSYFYSDSHNDLPLLNQVTHPVAVDPDPALEREARERGWPVISLRAPLRTP